MTDTKTAEREQRALQAAETELSAPGYIITALSYLQHGINPLLKLLKA